MASVTLGKSYFEALLRRAEFHTSGREFDTTPSLSSNVTISKAEHDYLLNAAREYNLLRSALFRGGLTTETLNTLLQDEGGPPAEEHTPSRSNNWEETFVKPRPVPVTMSAPRSNGQLQVPDTSATRDVQESKTPSRSYTHRACSYGPSDSSPESVDRDDDQSTFYQPGRVPTHDQRTVLITNLSDRTTHKDLVDIIRGGRLLDVFLRNDRSATISFVEGAQDFLAYAKKNDIYLHTKRLEFRWNDRQFHVPAHVSNKIANGATRNLVVRGAAGKQLTTDQIRDHLDHIHNLVVVDITMNNGDAYISTNSIHNALFARTCMMSRTVYKGLRIDWYADECARPLPKPAMRMPMPVHCLPAKAPLTNRYTVLDADSSDNESDDATESFMTSGLSLNNWADAAVA